jgi:hypothetical protein
MIRAEGQQFGHADFRVVKRICEVVMQVFHNMVSDV